MIREVYKLSFDRGKNIDLIIFIGGYRLFMTRSNNIVYLSTIP